MGKVRDNLNIGGNTDEEINAIIEQYPVKSGDTIKASDFVSFVNESGGGYFPDSLEITKTRKYNRTASIDYSLATEWGEFPYSTPYNYQASCRADNTTILTVSHSPSTGILYVYKIDLINNTITRVKGLRMFNTYTILCNIKILANPDTGMCTVIATAASDESGKDRMIQTAVFDYMVESNSNLTVTNSNIYQCSTLDTGNSRYTNAGMFDLIYNRSGDKMIMFQGTASGLAMWQISDVPEIHTNSGTILYTIEDINISKQGRWLYSFVSARNDGYIIFYNDFTVTSDYSTYSVLRYDYISNDGTVLYRYPIESDIQIGIDSSALEIEHCAVTRLGKDDIFVIEVTDRYPSSTYNLRLQIVDLSDIYNPNIGNMTTAKTYTRTSSTPNNVFCFASSTIPVGEKDFLLLNSTTGYDWSGSIYRAINQKILLVQTFATALPALSSDNTLSANAYVENTKGTVTLKERLIGDDYPAYYPIIQLCYRNSSKYLYMIPVKISTFAENIIEEIKETVDRGYITPNTSYMTIESEAYIRPSITCISDSQLLLLTGCNGLIHNLITITKNNMNKLEYSDANTLNAFMGNYANIIYMKKLDLLLGVSLHMSNTTNTVNIYSISEKQTTLIYSNTYPVISNTGSYNQIVYPYNDYSFITLTEILGTEYMRIYILSEDGAISNAITTSNTSRGIMCYLTDDLWLYPYSRIDLEDNNVYGIKLYQINNNEISLISSIGHGDYFEYQDACALTPNLVIAVACIDDESEKRSFCMCITRSDTTLNSFSTLILGKRLNHIEKLSDTMAITLAYDYYTTALCAALITADEDNNVTIGDWYYIVSATYSSTTSRFISMGDGYFLILYLEKINDSVDTTTTYAPTQTCLIKVNLDSEEITVVQKSSSEAFDGVAKTSGANGDTIDVYLPSISE